MAISHVLIESNFSYIPLLQQTSRSRPTLRSCALNINLKRVYSPCCIKTSYKLNTKCCMMNHKPQGEKDLSENKRGECNIFINKNAMSHKPDIDAMIRRSLENVMNVLRITVISGVLLDLLFLYDHSQGRVAFAASGGRMGGSSFSSSSSRSSSSSSSGSSSSSYRSPSSSSSYYTYNSYSSPKSSSSDEYRTQIGSPTPMTKAEAGFRNFIVGCIVIYLVYYAYINWYNYCKSLRKTSVVKLQVGLLGTCRSLQRHLNRIAESADTSNPNSLNYVLQESILSLLRRPDYCVLGYSSVDAKRGVNACEKRFNQLSIEERGKFDEETLVNVNNVKKKSATSHSSNGLLSEYIVVTIIVAANDVIELPFIKSSANLKKALQKLASIPPKNIMGVEVLWTPQKENDILTEQDMLKDYPRLRSL